MKKRPWELIAVANRWTSEGRRRRPWEQVAVESPDIVATSDPQATSAGELEELRASTASTGRERDLIAELRAIVEAA